MPTLRECFPAISHAELSDLLRRYRRVWRKRHRVPLRVLHWTTPGRVWAIDFSGPLAPIDGRFPYLLAVRDLASGTQLLALPVAAATAAVTCDALTSLFAQYGPPLVLKSDNGSAFKSGQTLELLARHGVVGMFSPPHWPRYNGSIEAGIGSLKGRAECRAVRGGRAGYWTWEDVEGARLEAITLSRPWGPSGPSPNELWSSRSSITAEERSAFQSAFATQKSVLEKRLRSCVGPDDPLMSEHALARSATRLALEERGYLYYRRRRIPPPIKRQKTDNIT